ncbi:hypothetical protein RP20_CCG010834 [Aedes albopictus]|nr:hypothetical protein RP20_CCG010834 [Aedes albopictus]
MDTKFWNDPHLPGTKVELGSRGCSGQVIRNASMPTQCQPAERVPPGEQNPNQKRGIMTNGACMRRMPPGMRFPMGRGRRNGPLPPAPLHACVTV